MNKHSQTPRLIAGLGNPGREYAHSRHNAGFICLDYFAREHKLAFSHRQSQARLAIGEVAGQKIVLAKPQTFMNQSGKAIAGLLQHFDMSPVDLVVIYDDMDLPLGKIRLRPGGSAGGHHGIESIIASLGTQDFARIRVGIGHPEETADSISHVLGDFSREEEQVFAQVVPKVGEAVICLLTEGISAAMSRFNKDVA